MLALRDGDLAHPDGEALARVVGHRLEERNGFQALGVHSRAASYIPGSPPRLLAERLDDQPLRAPAVEHRENRLRDFSGYSPSTLMISRFGRHPSNSV